MQLTMSSAVLSFMLLLPSGAAAVGFQAPTLADDAPPGVVFSSEPSIAVDGLGRIFVAWADNRGGPARGRFTRSLDGGKTFEASRPIWTPNPATCPSGRDEQSVAGVLVSQSGDDVYLIWRGCSGMGQYPLDYFVQCSTSHDGGVTFADPVIAGDLETDTWPAATLSASGTLYVAKVGARGAPSFNVYVTRSTNGATFSRDTAVLPLSSTSIQNVSLAADATDVLYVVFDQDSGASATTFGIVFSKSLDQAASFTPALMLDHGGSGSRRDPSLAVGPGGEVAVVFSDGRSGTPRSYVTRSTDGGDTWSYEVPIDDSSTGAGAAIIVGTPRGFALATVRPPAGAWSNYLVESHDAGLSWNGSRRISSASLVDYGATALAVGAGGTVWAAWIDARFGANDLFVARQGRAVVTAYRWLDAAEAPLGAESTAVTVNANTPVHLRLAIAAHEAWGLAPRSVFAASETPGSATTVTGSRADLSADDGAPETLQEGSAASTTVFVPTAMSITAGLPILGTLASAQYIDNHAQKIQEADRSGSPSSGPGDLEVTYSFPGLPSGAKSFFVQALKTTSGISDTNEQFTATWSASATGPFSDFAPPVLIDDLQGRFGPLAFAAPAAGTYYIRLTDTDPNPEVSSGEALLLDALSISVVEASRYVLGDSPAEHTYTLAPAPYSMGEYVLRVAAATSGEPFVVGLGPGVQTGVFPGSFAALASTTEQLQLYDLRTASFDGGPVRILVRDTLRAPANDATTADTVSLDLLEVAAFTGLGLEMDTSPAFTAPVQVVTQQWDDADHAGGAPLGAAVLAGASVPQVYIESRPYFATSQVDLASGQRGEWDFTFRAPLGATQTLYFRPVVTDSAGLRVYPLGTDVSVRLDVDGSTVFNAPPQILWLGASPMVINPVGSDGVVISCTFNDADTPPMATFSISLAALDPDFNLLTLCSGARDGLECGANLGPLSITDTIPYTASVRWDPPDTAVEGFYAVACTVNDGIDEATTALQDNPDVFELSTLASCTPVGASDATCDGVDDDCDGTADDDYVIDATCGVGHCRTSNTPSSCVAGVESPCAAGSPLGPSDASCDQLDDDCSGVADEDFVPQPTSCDVGACARVGSTTCAAGVVGDTCTPGAAAATDPTCDGVDDDCDGLADEEYVSVPDACGTGASARGGTVECVGGSPSSTCTPGTPAATDAICDGVDDDCNGFDDDDYVADSSCGLGPCRDTNTPSSCAGGVESACQPGAPLAESDATCDGFDDDCSGAADEDFVGQPTTCGVGACAGSGTTSCVAAVVADSCAPGNPLATQDSTCDGVDDDCDGWTDEDTSALGSCAPAGACEVAVCDPTLLACVASRRSDCCAAGGDCATSSSCILGSCGETGCAYDLPAGCCSAAADCDDGNACTSNRCGADGACTRDWVPGCCVSDADCDDGDSCSFDTCTGDARCLYQPLGCSAGPCGADQECVYSIVALRTGELAARPVSRGEPAPVLALLVRSDALPVEVSRLRLRLDGPTAVRGGGRLRFSLYEDGDGDGRADGVALASARAGALTRGEVVFTGLTVAIAPAEERSLLVVATVVDAAGVAAGWLGVACFALGLVLVRRRRGAGLGLLILGLSAQAPLSCARLGFGDVEASLRLTLEADGDVAVSAAPGAQLVVRGAPLSSRRFTVTY